MEYGTIKIPQDDYERHNERRKANGQTWLEYINGESPDVSKDAEVDYERLGSILEDRLGVDTSGASGPEAIAREVSRQLDYAQLASQVGDEVEERLR
jgi:hypothetical protein